MPGHYRARAAAARNEILAGYTVLSSDSKIRSTEAMHVKTIAFTSFPALSQTVGFAGLTWTSPSDANRIPEKSHAFGTSILGTRSEMGRARDRLYCIILLGPRR